MIFRVIFDWRIKSNDTLLCPPCEPVGAAVSLLSITPRAGY